MNDLFKRFNELVEMLGGNKTEIAKEAGISLRNFHRLCSEGNIKKQHVLMLEGLLNRKQQEKK